MSAITEIPTTQITPPPGTDESIEKMDYQAEGSSEAVRKQLFTQVHEQTNEHDTIPGETTALEDQTMPTPPIQQAAPKPEDK